MIYHSNKAETFRVGNRLIEEQVLFFEFCLKMLIASSKMAFKVTYEKNPFCQDCKLMFYALLSLDYQDYKP